MRPGLALKRGGGTDALSGLYVAKRTNGKEPCPRGRATFYTRPRGWVVYKTDNEF